MPEDGHRVEGSLYWYAPNHGAPIAFAVLFLLTGVLHTYQSFRFKSWRITWIYAWAALLFEVGYVLRAINSWNYTKDGLGVFIASAVLVYAAPPLYELGNYLVLGRCLHYIPHLSMIHPDRTLTLFLALSSVVEALTANGAARAIRADDNKEIETGKALLKTALILQLGIMGVQLLLGGRYNYLGRKSGIIKNNTGTADIQNVLITLYMSCFLITVRTIFRTVEYFLVSNFHPDPDTPESSVSVLIRFEWWFWFFEATLMFLNSVLLNWRHPGKFLPTNRKAYLDEQGVERDGLEFGDHRPVWRKIVDPLDLVGLVMGGDEKWWERDRMQDGEGERTNSPRFAEMRHKKKGKSGAVGDVLEVASGV